jgi:hypothetical protein
LFVSIFPANMICCLLSSQPNAFPSAKWLVSVRYIVPHSTADGSFTHHCIAFVAWRRYFVSQRTSTCLPTVSLFWIVTQDSL